MRMLNFAVGALALFILVAASGSTPTTKSTTQDSVAIEQEQRSAADAALQDHVSQLEQEHKDIKAEIAATEKAQNIMQGEFIAFGLCMPTVVAVFFMWLRNKGNDEKEHRAVFGKILSEVRDSQVSMATNVSVLTAKLEMHLKEQE